MARQIATTVATGEIILYMDGDIVPTPYLLELILLYYTNTKNYYVLKIPRAYRITLNKQIRKNRFNIIYNNHNFNSISFESFTSDCFCLHKDVIMEVGGWDTNFLGWGEEDVELAYRFHLSKIPILLKNHPYFYCIHIDHKVEHQKNFFSLQRNAKYFVKKHPQIFKVRNHMWQSLGVYLSFYGSSFGILESDLRELDCNNF